MQQEMMLTQFNLYASRLFIMGSQVKSSGILFDWSFLMQELVDAPLPDAHPAVGPAGRQQAAVRSRCQTEYRALYKENTEEVGYSDTLGNSQKVSL